MRSKPHIVFPALLLLVMLGNAQPPVKLEVEQSIRRQDTPSQLLEILSPFLEQAKRVRYFMQTGIDQVTWEVKMSYNGRQFSIEFFEDFQLKDVEELIRWRRLEGRVREPINKYYSDNYSRFRIKRFQKQFFPDTEVDPQCFLSSIFSGERKGPDGYEVEAEVRNTDSRKFGFYEYQFDQEFRLINKRQIIQDPDGNLLF